MRPLTKIFSVVSIAAALAALPALATAGETLERIKGEELVRFGFRTDAPPFSSLVDGAPGGFSIDLCVLVAGAIKDVTELKEFTAKFTPVGTGQRFDAIVNGDIDILCGATTATLDRREKVSFSIPTFITGVAALVRKDATGPLREALVESSPDSLSPAVVAEALKGRRIGVRRDTTAERWLREGPLKGIEDAEIVPIESHDAGIEQVLAGEIDVYFADQAILSGQVRSSGSAAELAITQKAFTNEPYALALPRGDEDFRLIIDRALSHLYRTGAILKLFERHFGQPDATVKLFYLMSALPE
jgi:ABC-type amino acid transport substrate-binding protein